MTPVRWARRAARPFARLAAAAVTGVTRVRRINGTTIRLPRRAARHMLPFVDVAYERAEWDAVTAFGSPGQSFLDVGANIGVLTVAMSRAAGPTGRVLAMEPQPRVYCLLTETLALNGCANAAPVQALVSDTCGAASFFVSAATELGVGSSMFASEAGMTELRVPTVSIDALYEAPARLDFLKIDAEGAEHRILRGAGAVLARCRPLVQVEVHGQYMAAAGESVAAMFADMAAHEYDCVNLLTWARVDAASFLTNTHYHIHDPATGEDLAYQGYGQVLFVPRERSDIGRLLDAGTPPWGETARVERERDR